MLEQVLLQGLGLERELVLELEQVSLMELELVLEQVSLLEFE